MKKTIALGIVFLFVLMSFTSISGIQIDNKILTPLDKGDILYVGGSGPGNYSKIQDAIDNASDGDTVFVYDDSAPYKECVIISKSITLVGENKNTTIIDGEYKSEVIQILVENVTVTNLNISRGDYGILVNDTTTNIQIINNNIYDNWFGIVVCYSFQCVVKNNFVFNSYQGIVLWHTNESVISNNNVSTDFYAPGQYIVGFYIVYSLNNQIKENYVTNCHEGINLIYSKYCNVHNNTARWNFGGILLTASKQNYVCDNFLLDNCDDGGGYGIGIGDGSHNNQIRRNYLRRNHIGCGADGKNIVADNIFIRNCMVGIKSNVKSDYYYNNTVINSYRNKNNVCSYKTNTWNNSYPIGGNYWNDYKGKDEYSGPNQDIPGADGIGDTPFEITDCRGTITGYDYYPLMEHGLGDNYLPNPTDIYGPIYGVIGQELTYTFVSTDPDGDWLDYYTIWGDNGQTNWNGPFPSGEDYTNSHTYKKEGTFTIKSVVGDEFGNENIGIFNVTITKPLKANAHGPYYDFINTPVEFNGSSSGGFPPYSYQWDFGDTHTSEEQNPMHTYTSSGNYDVVLTVTDNKSNTVSDTTFAWIQESNTAPDNPTIIGPTNGVVGTTYDYTFSATDPDNSILYLFVDWGDNSNTGWKGPYDSGQQVTFSHKWTTEDTFTIKAKAKDPYDAEGPWETLDVTIPRNKAITSNMLLLRILERFPLLQRLLNFWRVFSE